ncbi:MAG: CsbD family protein [Candidatus Rokuibacteriota bacterium]
MNRDTLKGQWMQLKGKIRQQWGKLTDDEVEQLQGNSEQLIGRVQERYGYTRQQAEQEVDRWLGEQRPDEGERPRKVS